MTVVDCRSKRRRLPPPPVQGVTHTSPSGAKAIPPMKPGLVAHSSCVKPGCSVRNGSAQASAVIAAIDKRQRTMRLVSDFIHPPEKTEPRKHPPRTTSDKLAREDARG